MRIKPMKLCVLGTTWSVVGKTVEEDARLKQLSGLTDFSTREIVIADMKEGEYDIADPHADMQRTLRHEIVHAFLAESGLWVCSANAENWAMNEEMVDWFALQAPKICDAMFAANAMPGARLELI